MKINRLFVISAILIVAVVAAQCVQKSGKEHMAVNDITHMTAMDSIWQAPDINTDRTLSVSEKELIIYGRELIAHTAKYVGPNGTEAQITNGMNCQNCHLDAGTRPWGNNFGAVAATYPQFRKRSNSVQGIYDRINGCMERSMNGNALDSNTREMKAMYAYMKWVGKDVPQGKKPNGAGLPRLPFLNRAADPAKGKVVYTSVCQACHGANGEGQLKPDKTEYIFPPLWGKHSYNDGAGLYRIGSFAAFVKNNMPFNTASHQHPVLTDEQAWDVAAYVNSQPRPHKDQKDDWHNIKEKPIDYPFGPYADSFSELQHKYGPFQPIADARNNNNEK